MTTKLFLIFRKQEELVCIPIHMCCPADNIYNVQSKHIYLSIYYFYKIYKLEVKHYNKTQHNTQTSTHNITHHDIILHDT